MFQTFRSLYVILYPYSRVVIVSVSHNVKITLYKHLTYAKRERTKKDDDGEEEEEEVEKEKSICTSLHCHTCQLGCC